MLGIVLYCIGVMYTPGPVNILSLNNGMQRKLHLHVPFCVGVGCALCFWFMLVGYTGSAILNEGMIPVIAGLGAGFILYLAYKIIFSDVNISGDNSDAATLNFKDGLLMQLLNPKSFLAVLPVATVQFPAVGVSGTEIAVWSILLSALGFGAPFVYAAFGSTVAGRIKNNVILKRFNLLMGVMLVAVAMDMAYEQFFLALR